MYSVRTLILTPPFVLPIATQRGLIGFLLVSVTDAYAANTMLAVSLSIVHASWSGGTCVIWFAYCSTGLLLLLPCFRCPNSSPQRLHLGNCSVLQSTLLLCVLRAGTDLMYYSFCYY